MHFSVSDEKGHHGDGKWLCTNADNVQRVEIQTFTSVITS